MNDAQTVLVTASDDKSARLWDLHDGKLIATLHTPVRSGPLGRLYGAAISSDNRIALGGTTAAQDGLHLIYLFDLTTHSVLGSFDARGGNIKCLKFSPDGELLAAVYADSPAVRVFDRQGGLVYEERLRADSYYVTFSSSGQMAVPVHVGAVQLYSTLGHKVTPVGEIKTDLSEPMGVSFSPDGRRLAVGYRDRTSRGRVRIDVFDAVTRKLETPFEFSNIDFGSLGSVAWQGNGEALYAAGSGYYGKNRFIAKRIDWPGGRSQDIDIGGDTVLDLVALRDGGIVFATAEPRWGIIVADHAEERGRTSGTRSFDASTLRANDSLTAISWENMADGTATYFDVQDRRAGVGRGNAERAPDTSRPGLTIERWRNGYEPTLNGARLPLAHLEISRAVAIVADGKGFLLATSRGLRKFDSTGHSLWMQLTSTEARSVMLSADGSIAVTAMLDGTIRWWRVSDGSPLMSFFALRDGRWVIWTELGYFDVSIGGEELIGWVVNRPEGDRTDFYPFSRFREKYFRPDVIDRILSDADPELALKRANEARRSIATEQGLAQNEETENQTAAEPLRSALPPIVELLTAPGIASGRADLDIEYTLLSESPVSSVTVRVDGRLYVDVSEGLPVADGKSRGKVVLPMPDRDSIVQIFATNKYGTSPPATFNYKNADKQRATVTQGDSDPPRLYVLSIGISRYLKPAHRLTGAAADARRVAEALLRQEGRSYKQVVAKILSDEQATRTAIVQTMRTYAAASRPQDVAILYLAGLATADLDGAYRFLGYEGDLTKLAATSVGEEEIGSLLGTIRGRMVVLLDTCHFDGSSGSPARYDLTRVSNKLASPEVGAVVLSSCSGRIPSGRGASNDVFAKVVVEGLAGAADSRHKGRVTYSDLGYFVSTRVKEVTSGSETPAMIAPPGLADFVLVANER